MGRNVGFVALTSSVSVVAVFFSLILGFGSFVHCQDLIHGRVSRVLNDPNHRTTNGTNLPSSLDLDVRLGKHDVHLRLLKDLEFKPQLPLFALTTDNQGNLQSQRAKLSEDEYGVYQDIVHEAAFGIFREKDDNDTSRYKLEGIVHSEGQVFELKSTGRHRSTTIRRRRRRDVVGDGNDSDSHQDDDSEEEEVEVTEEAFEVWVSPDKAADGADGVPPPPLPKQAMKKVMTLESLPPSFPPVASPPSSDTSTSSLPPPPPTRLPPRRAAPPKRRRRQVLQDVYIDVVALVDYAVYKAWYDRSTKTTSSEKRQDALENIRRYYAFVMNGVDLLYKGITTMAYKTSVRLVSVMVSTTVSSAQWTEPYRVAASRWDEVDANSALTALFDWAASTDTLPAYDHLMLFTGYDLTSTNGGVKTKATTGLAYVGTVCDTDGRATSIVEDLGGLQCVRVAAHELGHGLSAEHDGYENTCRQADQYIMAAGTLTVTSANKLNPWKFSSCSVNYFNTYLQKTVGTARGRQCLYNTLTVAQDVPDVTSQVAGQVYDPDTQCRQIYGPSSYLCRSSEFGQPADVCTSMFCFDPSTTNRCIQLKAARGTTCGSQKWCQSGLCVSSAAAPVADATCVYGDQPGVAFQGLACATFVAQTSSYCYQEVVRSRCCTSCAKVYRHVTDCEYGDKSLGCQSGYCSHGDDSYLRNCCRTCNYGSTFTPTTTTTLPGGSTVTAPTTTQVCVDDSSFTFNLKTCPALVPDQPHLCYDSVIRSRCCLSCRHVATSAAGCEYGDSQPTQCYAAQTNLTACSTVYSFCCKTCAAYWPPSGGQEASAVVTAYVTLSVSLIVTLFLNVV